MESDVSFPRNPFITITRSQVLCFSLSFDIWRTIMFFIIQYSKDSQCKL